MIDADEPYRSFIKDLLRQNGFCPDSYCKAIGPKDEMFYKAVLPGYRGNPNLALFHYFTSAVRVFDIYRQLAASIGGFSAIGPVLDFGSGWGRLTRSLVHHLDPAKIRVCDVYGDAIAWQKEIFGVEGFVSVSDPDAFTYREQNSIVLVGSVFSHFPPRLFKKWLCRLYSLVKPGGIMAFSVHAEPLLPSGEQIGEQGITYLSWSESDSLKEDTYGMTYVTEEYVAKAIAATDATRRVAYRRFQKALYENQDLYVVAGADVDISNLKLMITPFAGIEAVGPAAEFIRYRGWGIDLNPREQLVTGEVFAGRRRIAELKPVPGNDSVLKYFPGAVNSPVSWHCDLPRDLGSSGRLLRFTLSSSAGAVCHCYAGIAGAGEGLGMVPHT